MRFEEFKYRLPAYQWKKAKLQTVKVWHFILEWIIERGESDCFDDEALESLEAELGIKITLKRWTSHLRSMEQAGLLQGHRIAVSLEFGNPGNDFLMGVHPGAYIAYTLPGLLPVGRQQAFLAVERISRRVPEIRKKASRSR